jgi:hypothetical protein
VLPESGSHCEPDRGPFDTPRAAEMLSSRKT